MAIGISPLVDFAFKMLLGNARHPRLTVHFLNALLGGKPRIVSARILNPIQNRNKADGKQCVLDILAVDELGRQLIIEVQTWIPCGMAQRLVYYTSLSCVSQMKKGRDYPELRPTICICVLAEPLFPNPPALHLDFRLREKDSGRTLTDDLQIHLLHLPHSQVTAETLYNASPKERWAWFLLNADKLTSQEITRLFPEEEFTEAAGVLDMIAQTPEEFLEYNLRLKFQRDESARMQRALLEGHERGRREGFEVGREEGRTQGRILLVQELLGLPLSTSEEPGAWTTDQLHSLAADLQRQLKARRI